MTFTRLKKKMLSIFSTSNKWSAIYTIKLQKEMRLERKILRIDCADVSLT